MERDRGAFNAAIDDTAGPGLAQGGVHRQPQQGAGVQFEFVLRLGDHGDHAGVVRTRADFREPDLIAGHEELDAEDAQPAQVGRDGQRDLAGALQRGGRHRVRLPAFYVVAIDLFVADGFAVAGFDLAVGAPGAHGQQGDLVVEADESFDNGAPAAHPAAFLGVAPGRDQIVGAFDHGLALARRRHDRLDDAGIANAAVDGLAQFVLGVDKTVGRSRQPEGFGRQAPDALAVHGQLGRASRRRHPRHARRFQFHQQTGGNGLDFGDNNVRPLLFDDFSQGLRVRHGDHMRPMRHLVARGVRIPVHRDHFHAQPLQGNDDLFAQFPGPEQHDAGSQGGQWRAKDGAGNAGHGAGLERKFESH
ncbi:hypothetical protein D3C85_994500 [compost metagenome]